MVRRFGQLIGVKPESIELYEQIHAAVWPEVLATIHACNMRNYSIFRQGTLQLSVAPAETTGEIFSRP